MATRERRFPWVFVVLGVIAVGLFAWAIFGKAPAKTQKPQAVPVSVAKASLADVPLTVDALGAAQPWSSVTIHVQANGRLIRVLFHEGSYVKAGQLLAQIDPGPYQAALMQAQGTLKRDQALLENARLDLKRYQALAKLDSISGQQADTQAALVKQDEGTVLIDQGAVKAAQINLGYTSITAPTDGRVGLRLVDPGNIVSTADTTGLVIINQITPIAVTFTVPQGDFARLAQASDGFRHPLTTQAFSQETSALVDTGALDIADNHVDPSTATVALKARFPNANGQLWPNQFLDVKLTVQTLENAVTVPSTAVVQGTNGSLVYVVGPDAKASPQPVILAATEGDTAVIKSGVSAGQTVVTDGQMSLQKGASVCVVGGRAAGKPQPKSGLPVCGAGGKKAAS